jgi:hypothetical protein
VVFSSEQIGGLSIRGDGFTRDISPSGVFVFATDPLPSGVVVNLAITLPSLRGQHSGACLRTVGHVVRTESAGFAAVADLGFRMQFPDSQADESGRGAGEGNSGTHQVRPAQRKGERPVLASRFSM